MIGIDEIVFAYSYRSVGHFFRKKYKIMVISTGDMTNLVELELVFLRTCLKKGKDYCGKPSMFQQNRKLTLFLNT